MTGDPYPQFNISARVDKSQLTDIPLERVLCDFQDDEFVRGDLSKMAVVGFARYERGRVFVQSNIFSQMWFTHTKHARMKSIVVLM